MPRPCAPVTVAAAITCWALPRDFGTAFASATHQRTTRFRRGNCELVILVQLIEKFLSPRKRSNPRKFGQLGRGEVEVVRDLEE